ncbi:hypothetical protein, partial [Frankia sp. CIT1]|uniref:hypothetical protein n=1 Tax=Frankia sp. CIT1 TaxID=2880974 RepID=UPI001EF5AEFC
MAGQQEKYDRPAFIVIMIGVCLSLGTPMRAKTVHNDKHAPIMDRALVADRSRNAHPLPPHRSP